MMVPKMPYTPPKTPYNARRGKIRIKTPPVLKTAFFDHWPDVSFSWEDWDFSLDWGELAATLADWPGELADWSGYE